MKRFFLIVPAFLIIIYCLLSMVSDYNGAGPLDTYPRNIKTIKCQKIEARVYRRKMLDLISTDNRIEIKQNEQIILDERLQWTDIWKDVEFESLTLECEGNAIKTSSKHYFDNYYKINTDGTFKKEKKFTW